MTSLSSKTVGTGIDVGKLVATILSDTAAFDKYVGGLAGVDKLIKALQNPTKADWLVAAAAHMSLLGPFGMDNESFICAGQTKAYSVRAAVGTGVTRATWQAFVSLVGDRIKQLRSDWKQLRGDSVKAAALASGQDDLWPACGDIVAKKRDPSASKPSTSKFVVGDFV
jgi:hypothetical protein